MDILTSDQRKLDFATQISKPSLDLSTRNSKNKGLSPCSFSNENLKAR